MDSLDSNEPLDGLNPEAPMAHNEQLPAFIPGTTLKAVRDIDDARWIDEDVSPIEQVALTVPTDDDHMLPVWTFRMWVLGLTSCVLLAFLNQFFAYRTEPLTISAISAQIVTLPLGKLMAATLPTRHFRLPYSRWTFTLNPGPFNIKEHVLITIFANAGASFGNGDAYAVSIVNITKAFYKRNMTFVAALVLVLSTQIMGYGWAGLLRKYLVDPAHMWWPGNMVQVSLFRTLHERETKKGLSRIQFFLIATTMSFAYYILPGYLFSMLTAISWVCWVWPKSVTAQQLGSGLKGLGLGAVGLDWSTTASYLGSPLVTPYFAVVNVFVGFLIITYIVMPACYWNNIYDGKRYPIFSSHLFTYDGQRYDITKIVNSKFELDEAAYKEEGPLRLTSSFAVTYGFGFAALTATLSHVGLFYGKEIWQRWRASLDEKPDVHTRLMKKYPDIPNWWFVALLFVTLGISIATYVGYKEELQLPWWGLIMACGMAAFFTLPIGIIAATTNQFAGLNIITEYVMGLILEGKPIANVSFKTYGHISMTQALAFLQDFKLGHYMKIPPRSMFMVQFLGTAISGAVNLGVAWWLLESVDYICDTDKLPINSPWTCPSDRVFFDASVIWGLVGPRRMFGSDGQYHHLNWFFLLGAVAPVPVWLLSRTFPKVKWLRLVNLPILFGAANMLPPATPVNYISWFTVGTIFSFIVFRLYKPWWTRYNYVLSAALDAGLAFMAVTLYFTLGMNEKSLDWWGNNLDNCPLASCPTAPGVNVTGCPVF